MNAKEYKKKIESYSIEELEHELRSTKEYLKIIGEEKKRGLVLKQKIIEEVLSFSISDDNFIFIDNENIKITEEVTEEIINLSLEKFSSFKKREL